MQPDTPLKGLPLAVFDFEATGPIPTEAHPVSVAVVHVDLGTSDPVLAHHTLIRPPVPIPEESSAIHGITDEAVADAPTMAEALPDLMAALDGRMLAAFNLPYDWQILARFASVPFVGICAYVPAKAIDKYQRGKRLSDVCARRDVPLDAHRAESDALATAHLLPVLLRQLGRGVHRQDRYGRWHHDGPWCRPADLQTVGAYLEWQARAARAQEADYAAYRATQGQEPPTMPWTALTGEEAA